VGKLRAESLGGGLGARFLLRRAFGAAQPLQNTISLPKNRLSLFGNSLPHGLQGLKCVFRRLPGHISPPQSGCFPLIRAIRSTYTGVETGSLANRAAKGKASLLFSFGFCKDKVGKCLFLALVFSEYTPLPVIILKKQDF
jgi:hypothetical protein